MAGVGDGDLEQRLRVLQRGAGAQVALAFFEDCAPVRIEELFGSWRGTGLTTGHPLDGLLELYGWHGKRFDTAEVVHPLVFRGNSRRLHGDRFSVNPALMPLGLVTRINPVLRTRVAAWLGRGALRAARTSKPGARLRMVEYRGVPTATMIYDALPINDHFRRVADDTLIGVMDLRDVPQPFFFVLRRES